MKSFLKLLAMVCILFGSMNSLYAQWIQMSGPSVGDVVSMTVNSTNVFATNHLLSGGGVLRSTNNGANWISAGLSGKVIEALISHSDTVFAGGPTDGIYMSPDNGATWTSKGKTSSNIVALAHNGTVLLAGSLGSGIFKSTNNGTTWSFANTGLGNYYVRSFVVAGTNIFAGTNSGVYVSTDNGANWSAATTGLPNSNISSLVTIDPYLFAAVPGYSGVYLSTDNGTSWTAANTGLINTVVHALAVSGSNLFAGTEGGVFLSTDYGTSWSAVNSGLTSTYVRSLIINGATIFAGTNTGGVFRSSNNGTNWNSAWISNCVANSFVSNGSNLFAGTDYGVYLSTDDGTTWTAVNNGLPVNPNTYPVQAMTMSGTNLFAGTSNGVFLSTNNGGNWTATNTGLTNTTIRCLLVHGTDIYAGTNGGAFISFNNGTNWLPINDGLTDPYVIALTYKGTNLFAATSAGVFVSTDDGSTWTSSGISSEIVYSLAVDGSNLYAGTYNNGVYLSTNNGATWTPVNSGLTTAGVTVNSLTINSTKLFASIGNSSQTGGNVFSSADNGASWTSLNTGLGSAAVKAITFYGSYLFAGTSGSGVWRRLASETLPVELSSFTAFAQKNAIELQWKTATEVNNYGFEIEKSRILNSEFRSQNTAETWSKIGFIEGSGTTNATKEYSFTDKNGTAGKFFYRLKQIDRDGKFSYSQAVEVTIGSTPKEFALEQNYPNPFNPATTISYNLVKVQNLDKVPVTLKIYDVIGREVATLVNEVKEAGSYSATFDASKLSSGIYFARLQSGDQVQLRKMTLLK